MGEKGRRLADCIWSWRKLVAALNLPVRERNLWLMMGETAAECVNLARAATGFVRP